MELYPLKSSLVEPNMSLTSRLEDALDASKLRLRDGDIIAIASKVVSLSEGRVRKLSGVKPTKYSIKLGKQYSLTSEFAQIVVDEAEKVYGGVEGAILTLKDGHATANAGVDRKNSPGDSVVLWPVNAGLSALRLWRKLGRKSGANVGVIIVDSRVTPLRLGTIGLALASVGFRPVKDIRGEPDLYGRSVRITFQAVGDGIAAAAHVLMGEARERVPFVLIRGAPVKLGGEGKLGEKMAVKDCLFMSQISA